MKYLIGILVIIAISIGLIIAVVSYLDKIPSLEDTYVLKEQLIERDNFTWYQPASNTLNLVLFKNKDLVIDFTEKNAQSLKEQARSDNFQLIVNGGYFLGSNLDAQPIGILNIKGEEISKRVQDSQNQVTQVVVFDHQEKSLSVFQWDKFLESEFTGERYSILQAGPIVLKEGELQTEAIEASINGASPYVRTLIGFTEDGVNILVVSRVSFTLQAIAKELQNLPVLKDKKLTLVNLDGGSSSGMYAPNLLQFSFGENKRLPYVIGIPK